MSVIADLHGAFFAIQKGLCICQGGSVYTWSRTTLFILLPQLPRRTVLMMMMSLLLVAPSLSLVVSCWVSCERKSKYKASIIHCQAKEGLKFCQVRSLFREILGTHTHAVCVPSSCTACGLLRRLLHLLSSLSRAPSMPTVHACLPCSLSSPHTVAYRPVPATLHSCPRSRACGSTPPGVGPVPSQFDCCWSRVVQHSKHFSFIGSTLPR